VAALHVCATPNSERVSTPLCWTQLKGDPAYRYREFWHVTSCARCGEEMSREGDEYYGDDMADIHWKWRQ